MKNTSRSLQSGITMLEVLIASVILSVIVMMSSWLVWSSADHVANTEAWVKTEKDLREVLDQMVKDLHQCRAGLIAKVDTTKPIPTDAVSMAATASPGTVLTTVPPYPIWDAHELINAATVNNNVYTNSAWPLWYSNLPSGPPNGAFDGIRFRIAAPMMELTAVSRGVEGTKSGQQLVSSVGLVNVDGTDTKAQKKIMRNNASADWNGKTDPYDPTGKKKVWNFDLSKFKAGLSQANDMGALYEITYWWEVDQQATTGVDAANTKGEGTLNAASPSGYLPDGIDNNKNGIVDEGVIKKMETWYNPDGTLDRRVVTTVLKDCTALQFSIPMYPQWVNRDPATNAVLLNQYKVGSEKTVMISITVKKSDPRFLKDAKKQFVKTVTAFVDLRN